jgi:hypothetical protein
MSLPTERHSPVIPQEWMDAQSRLHRIIAASSATDDLEVKNISHWKAVMAFIKIYCTEIVLLSSSVTCMSLLWMVNSMWNLPDELRY